VLDGRCSAEPWIAEISRPDAQRAGGSDVRSWSLDLSDYRYGSISPGIAGELSRVALSPAPSASLPPAIFFRRTRARCRWPPLSSHEPFWRDPRRPAPCRRPAADVLAPSAWRPLPSPVHARGSSAPVRRRVRPSAPPPCRLARRKSSSACGAPTCGRRSSVSRGDG
jgi:hypothetical protein